MKCTLRYLQVTLDFGLLLRCSASSELTVYTNTDWASCPDTRLRCVSQHQPLLMVFEASERHLPLECRGRVPGHGQWHGGGLLVVATTSGALRSTNKKYPCLLQQRQCHLPLYQPHSTQRMKHVEIDLQFVRECMAIGDVRIMHVMTTSQFTDIFRKGLPTSGIFDALVQSQHSQWLEMFCIIGT
jgi:hypothetical protein